MTSSVVNCPLCSQPAFTSLASLSMCLVNVTTRALDCPVCHDTLPGLDKFTIHIFGHALNQQINNKTSSNGEISCDKNVLKVLSSTSSNNIIPIEIPLFIRNIDTQNYVMKDVNNKDFDSNNCMIAIASDDNNNNNEETTSSPKEVLKIVPLEVNTNNIFDTNDECSNIIPQECNLSKNNADLDDLDRNKDLLKNLEPYLKYSQVKTKIFKESNCTIVQNSSLSVPDSQAAQLSNKVNSLESSSAEIDNSIDDSSSETNTTKGLLSSNNLNFCQKNNDNYSDAIFKYYVGCDNASNSISCNDGKEVRSLLLEGKDFDSVRTTVNFDELVDDSDSSKTAKDISRRICKKSRDCSTTTQGVQTIEESFTKNNNPFSKFSPIDTNCSELDDHQESSDVDHPISENADSPQIANQNLFVDSSSSYWCDVCLFTFPDLAILKMHKNLVHGDHQGFGDTEKKTYACHLCSKSFNMRGSLMVHRRVAHPVVSGGTVSLKNIEKFKDLKSSASFDETTLQYCCKTCGKSFKKEQHLTQHERTHEVKQWECDICSKVFSTKYFLKKHKRLHTGEMPYTCTTCGKSFTFQQSYHKHLLYHSDEKPHVCCDCGRAFKELSTLHNHQRIHTGEKPFSCETCGKCFRQRVSYLVHRRIHTGVMPYKCTVCNKSFRYKVSERTHKCNNISPGNVVDRMSEVLEKLQKVEEIKSIAVKNLPVPTPSQSDGLLATSCKPSITNQMVVETERSNLANKPQVGGWMTTNQQAENQRENCGKNCEGAEFWTETTNFPRTTDRPQSSSNENIFSAESTDFLAFALTPTFSPSEQFQHLSLSPDASRNWMTAVDSRNCSTGVERSSHSADTDRANLETINEQSLKELLYNVDDFQ